MTVKDLETVVSQIPDLRFQFIVRIQFHLQLEMNPFFKVTFDQLNELNISSNGAKKMITGYQDLFDCDDEFVFLLKNETVNEAEEKTLFALKKVLLNGKNIGWSDLAKNKNFTTLPD